MNLAHNIRWYAVLAKDLLFKPTYRPHDFWNRRHRRGHNFWTVGRRSFDESGNREWYARLAKDLATEFHADGLDLRRLSVCEIGAGIGYWTRMMRDHGCKRYLGTEIADPAATWLRPQFPDYDFVVADVAEDPLPGTWDVIVMMHVDEHIHGERFLNALRHIKAAMTPTSRFFTTYRTVPTPSGVSYVEYHTQKDFAAVFPLAWIKPVPRPHGGDAMLSISAAHARSDNYNPRAYPVGRCGD
ncbi:MAG: class I SAM-dependent methyltransferase [Chthoniobacterales bacterium]|nr:class I SAM-dependent methyltransferase [Chthoniobacterales bacterium]